MKKEKQKQKHVMLSKTPTFARVRNSTTYVPAWLSIILGGLKK